MKLYSIYEIANMFEISDQVIRREIKRNKLIGRRFGGRIFVLEKDLEDYIKSSATNYVEGGADSDKGKRLYG